MLFLLICPLAWNSMCHCCWEEGLKSKDTQSSRNTVKFIGTEHKHVFFYHLSVTLLWRELFMCNTSQDWGIAKKKKRKIPVFFKRPLGGNRSPSASPSNVRMEDIPCYSGTILEARIGHRACQYGSASHCGQEDEKVWKSHFKTALIFRALVPTFLKYPGYWVLNGLISDV